MWGSDGTRELWCGGVVVWESFGLRKLQCVGVVARGYCVEGELWGGRVVV